MHWQNTRQPAKLEYLLLIPILALAFYLAFIPNQDYPYPVHIDEWVHIAKTEAVLKAQDTTYVDPFNGRSTISLGSELKIGFHVFWGIFNKISGISWMTIVRYFPSIIFMLTALSVYILARKEGFGWEAALFTCLIPTTVGIMGPAFFIPVAMALLFVPLSLFILFNFKTWWAYLILFIFNCFLITIHAPSALCLVIIFIPFILLNLKHNFRHSLGIAMALAIPFLVTLPWTLQSYQVQSVINYLFVPKPHPPYHDLPRIIQEYGHLPIISAILGTFLLCIKGGIRNYSLPLGLLAVLLMLAVFYTLHYGEGIMYLRGLLFMMLMMGIVAGAGLMGLRKLELPGMSSIRLKAPLITKIVGIFLCLAFIGATLAIAIPDRQKAPYYHMINESDYEAFIWIRDNVDTGYERAILDPWKATAFTAITSKYVYTRIHMAPNETSNKATAFLTDGCVDTDFLRENGISIVYNTKKCSNPDLVEVRENVYLLDDLTP